MAIHAQTFHCIGLWFVICIDVFKKQFICFFFHNFKQTSVKFKVRPPNFLKISTTLAIISERSSTRFLGDDVAAVPILQAH